MRCPLAVLALLAALAAGCGGTTPCSANADCPVQSYCALADGGARGACRQECQATADCHDPALRCSSVGQCVPVAIPIFDAGVDAPPDAAPPDLLDGALDDALADAPDGAPEDVGASD